MVVDKSRYHKQCGPIRFRLSARKAAETSPFQHEVFPRLTGFVWNRPENETTIQEIYAALFSDQARNDLIVRDLVPVSHRHWPKRPAGEAIRESVHTYGCARGVDRPQNTGGRAPPHPVVANLAKIRGVRETQTTEFPVILHRDEREAILLAESLRADVLLIDEQIGRTIALSSRKIALSGTLGVLERADLMRFLDDFPQVLKQLKASGFFIADPLERQLLQRHDARRVK